MVKVASTAVGVRFARSLLVVFVFTTTTSASATIGPSFTVAIVTLFASNTIAINMNDISKTLDSTVSSLVFDLIFLS
jgi:hypothetical protein